MARPRVLLALAVTAVALAGCREEDGVGTVSSGRATAPGSTHVARRCADADAPVRWTACPPARRIRALLRERGYDVFFDQGAAWFATDHRTATFSIGATCSPPGTARTAGPLLARVAGARVHGDWAVRVAWDAHDRTWWLEPQGAPAGERPARWHLRLPRGRRLSTLVRASLAHPLPGRC